MRPERGATVLGTQTSPPRPQDGGILAGQQSPVPAPQATRRASGVSRSPAFRVCALPVDQVDIHSRRLPLLHARVHHVRHLQSNSLPTPWQTS